MIVPKVSEIDRFTRIFYSIKLVLISSVFLNSLDSFQGQLGEKIWLSQLLKRFVQDFNDFSILGFLETIFIVFILLFPAKKSFKLVEALLSLLLFSVIISIDSIGHSFHSLLIVSFPISFLSSQNVSRIIPMALNFHLLTYFSSGFWKLALLVREVFAWNFYSYSKSALINAMTKKALELSRSLSLVDAFVALPSFISVILWLIVILFQVGMIYFVLKSHYPMFLGLLIICFHSLTLFLMDINYMEAQALTCILFFCGVPLIKDSEDGSTDTSLKLV